MAAARAAIDFTHLMTSGQYSDLKLVCQGQEFRIHKLVACSQSSVIATALKGGFKEAQSGIITIEAFDAETVRRMVEYLYTGDYDKVKANNNVAAPVAVATSSITFATSSTTISTPSAAPSTVKSQGSSAPVSTAPPTPALVVTKGTLHHVQVNAIADYYGIQGLALLANQKIQQAYFTNWDAKAFAASAKAAISVSGDKSLHNMMALLTAQRLKELRKSGQLTSLVGEFAASVLHYHDHLLEASQHEQGQVGVQQQNDLQVRCQAAEARTARVIENFDKLVNLTNNREYCRNGACCEEFGSYIEAAGDDPAEPTYILRCSWCGCRHFT
ncbi:hypothetical protein GGI43DRAFT_3455 [Trichoderma evansii]